MEMPRRVFISGGLAALALTACGRSGLSGTSTTTTTSMTVGGAGSTPTMPAVADLIGSYEIVDLDTGTRVTVTVDATTRRIVANGLPDHVTGSFPNTDNPNSISAQSYDFSLPVSPTVAESSTAYNVPQSFGIAVNGVPFDPFAAEWWERDRTAGWQYEALGGGIDLGLDQNNAHVQPTGAYHYHGMPTALAGVLDPAVHSPLLGWAGDGFPIYARYLSSDAMDPTSPAAEMTPSYRIRSGERNSGPGGAFDGTFVEDYEFVEGLGTLDACNGRFAATPEYPNGTYLYVLTTGFPVIPRCFAGAIADDFVVGGPGG